MSERVESIVAHALGSGAVVTSRTRLPGGASRETWALDVSVDGTRRELVLRLDSPGASLNATGGGLPAEARLMRAAAEAGVPVPAIVAASGGEGGPPYPLKGAPDDRGGVPYILMERVGGETIPRKILRDAAFARARPLLAAQCGAALAAVHRMPLDAVTVTGEAGQDPLLQWRDVLDLTGQPHPVFELAFRRLAASRPPPAGRTVVHGDFRNGNLIVGPEGVRAVLDWELAHTSDPIEDLGWLCVKAWRFGSPLPVGGFGGYDELIDAYEQAGGRPVDRAALRWWETFGVLKWGVICVMQTMRHLAGGARSVELAAIGRRVCENEWDLLELLNRPAAYGSRRAG
ncbi:phosphotransferase family protein [Nonomuraea sp. NBC_01738]|uniref:phosphotransferase family protein n=1 Tax=Nonomuraea sp. NBC_01738 TaxID=2976003 RepID=UPI002E116288|nr:phosphotransferase family protein [Nonomuraea sp. NBC_01738]